MDKPDTNDVETLDLGIKNHQERCNELSPLQPHTADLEHRQHEEDAYGISRTPRTREQLTHAKQLSQILSQ